MARRTGIEGWFDTPASVQVIGPVASAPPRWKQMVSLFTVVLVTPVMTYLAMPLVTRALRPWLTR